VGNEAEPAGWVDWSVAIDVPTASSASWVAGSMAGHRRPGPVLRDSAELSDDNVRRRCAEDLVGAGLAVPERWDHAALKELHSNCERRALSKDGTDDQRRAEETLRSLCLAVTALPIVAAFTDRVSTKKLKYLYLRHVGCWPEAGSLEEMLVLAASAGIREYRRSRQSADGSPEERVTALARFLLGIAAQASGPDEIALDDPAFRGLTHLVTQQLRHQWADADRYLKDIRRRTWAVIEIVAPDFHAREWPSLIIVDSVSDRGEKKSRRFDCTSASRAGLEDALQNALNWLPEGEIYLDLSLPRPWLDAGVEHWNVVDVGGVPESISLNYKPRLRWTKHRNHPALRDRQRKRFLEADWLADPADIPVPLADDEAAFAGWLARQDRPGTRCPPFITGGSSRADTRDPLRLLLHKGYGCITWFSKEAPDDVRQTAREAADGLSVQQRKDWLPEELSAVLAGHQPVIIWNDPDGREDFPMPPPRPAGNLRRGRG
jgi:hypothetical protein